MTDKDRKNFFYLFRYPLLVFIISRVVVFGAATYIGTLESDAAPRKNGPMWRGYTQEQNIFLEPWRRWDALWFINVAREGYKYQPDRQSNVTIFPLYPVLLKSASVVFRNHVFAGLAVSNLCLLLLTLLLYSMTREMFGEDAARGAVVMLYAFPAAFLLSGVYSESLFLLLCMASLWCGRKEKWAAAGALGALATATRIAGVALVPVLLIQYFHQRGFSIRKVRADVLYPLLAPLGLLLFFFYLRQQTGDYFVYFEAQKKWAHAFTTPLSSIAFTLNAPMNFTVILQLATALAFFTMCVISLYRVNLSMGLFSLFIVLLSMSASNLNGLPRYVLPAFAVYIALGAILKKPAGRYAAAAALAVCQLYCMFLFITWKLSF